MSDNLFINLQHASLNYSSQLPFVSPRMGIRTSSFLEDAEFYSRRADAECSSRRFRVPFPVRHGTNISSSPKSASLIPDYPIPVPYSRIRSSTEMKFFYSKLSKALRISGSKMPGALPGAKMPGALLGTGGSQNSNIFYSKVFRKNTGNFTVVGVELESNWLCDAVSLRF